MFSLNLKIITNGLKKEKETSISDGAVLEVPGTLVGKLPVQFKKLGFDTHAKFDQLALDAEEFGDSDHALSQLSTLMKNCTACHAAYRFDISGE